MLIDSLIENRLGEIRKINEQIYAKLFLEIVVQEKCCLLPCLSSVLEPQKLDEENETPDYCDIQEYLEVLVDKNTVFKALDAKREPLIRQINYFHIIKLIRAYRDTKEKHWHFEVLPDKMRAEIKNLDEDGIACKAQKEFENLISDVVKKFRCDRNNIIPQRMEKTEIVSKEEKTETFREECNAIFNTLDNGQYPIICCLMEN